MITTKLIRRVRVLLAVSVVLVLVGACGGDGPGDTGPTVEFFDGIIPDTVPSDFPFPAEGVPGASLINRGGGDVITELTMRVPAPRTSVFAYFQANLPLRDYEVVSVDDQSGRLEIAFEKDDVAGTVSLEEEISIQVTTVVLEMESPS